MEQQHSNTAITIPQQQIELAKNIDNLVSVFQNKEINGFQKAFVHASVIQELELLLTPEYMKPIMYMQGKKLGFKTDLDKQGGYKEETVRACLIEATLTGVQVSGNQFNIISANCYITKEGFAYLLKQIKGLWHEEIYDIPKAIDGATSVSVTINWKLDGIQKSRVLTFPVKVNTGMSGDAIIGKAKRKALAWLYNDITDSEIGDGDVLDADVVVIKQGNKIELKEDTPHIEEVEAISMPTAEEQKRGDAHLSKADSKEKLEKRLKEIQVKIPHLQLTFYNKKLSELTK